METAVILLCVVVVLTLIFDFINGFHDAANAIATVVSTRVMRPTTAVLYGGILNFAGALLGTEVAATIGKGLVDANVISLQTVMCTVLAAIVWNLITWYKGLPTSSSHAIIGSLMGATFASTMSGHSIIWPAVYKKSPYSHGGLAVDGAFHRFHAHGSADMGRLPHEPGENKQDLRQAADFVSRLYGAQSWPQRRTEIHGYYRSRARAGFPGRDSMSPYGSSSPARSLWASAPWQAAGALSARLARK